MNSYAAHIITADADALGDPAIVVIAHDTDPTDPDHTADAGIVLAEYPLIDTAATETDAVLTGHGWSPAGEATTVQPGYRICGITPGEWPLIIREITFARKTAATEYDRQDHAWRWAIRAAFHDKTDATAIAEHAEIARSRVYQIRDHRR